MIGILEKGTEGFSFTAQQSSERSTAIPNGVPADSIQRSTVAYVYRIIFVFEMSELAFAGDSKSATAWEV